MKSNLTRAGTPFWAPERRALPTEPRLTRFPRKKNGLSRSPATVSDARLVSACQAEIVVLKLLVSVCDTVRWHLSPCRAADPGLRDHGHSGTFSEQVVYAFNVQ